MFQLQKQMNLQNKPKGESDLIRVLLAEDQATVREALAVLLSIQEDIEVVAQVSRGDEVVHAAEATKPDIALLDIEMPGMDGIEAAAALRKQLPTCRVLILTTFGRPGYLRRAMESGSVGFLVKEAPAAQLAISIRRAIAGERIVDPALAAAALSDGDSPLTNREREVLSAASKGLEIPDIATNLSLSEGTVRNYLSEAIQKMNAKNRIEAARIAFERGWL
jgi:two-component system response regulator DesR